MVLNLEILVFIVWGNRVERRNGGGGRNIG